VCPLFTRLPPLRVMLTADPGAGRRTSAGECRDPSSDRNPRVERRHVALGSGDRGSLLGR
jgi:hypothetical protein